MTIPDEIPMVAKGGLADKTKITTDLEGMTAPVAFNCKTVPFLRHQFRDKPACR